MDYALFKTLIPQRIKEFLPPVFHSYEPRVNTVMKVNGPKDAFCLIPPERDPEVAIPTLYLDDLYLEFQEDEDLDGILELIARIMVTWSGTRMPGLAEFDVQGHTDRIVANLVNAGMNQELKENVPHTDFLDMTVIYRLVHSVTEDGINSAIITNDMIDGTGLDAKEIHRLAMENTPRLFPAKLIEGSDKEVCVMTNESGLCGATTMLYSDDMQRLAEHMGGDYFIMPTSIHEFFAVSADKTDPYNLFLMLAEGNHTITRPEELLSYAIYRYRAKEGKISIVPRLAGFREEKNG